MFSSTPLVYCQCLFDPLPQLAPCPNVHSAWSCPVTAPVSSYGTGSEGMATHGASQGEGSEPSASRMLKFGIENILYGISPSDQAAQSQISFNQQHSFVAHRSFRSRVHSTSRPWCRPVFTRLQRRGLEKRFLVSKYVTKRERLQLGALLNLTETQVKVWFQNRRTKWRQQATQREENEKEKKVTESSKKEEEDLSSQRKETDEQKLVRENQETAEGIEL